MIENIFCIEWHNFYYTPITLRYVIKYNYCVLVFEQKVLKLILDLVIDYPKDTS